MTTQTETGHTAGSPGQNGTPAATTGNGLAIVGLVLAFLPFLNIAGLVVSIIGRRAARRQNRSTKIGTIGIIVSSLSIIFTLVMVGIAVVAIGFTVAQCGDLGPGTHLVDGVTYTCS